MLIVLKLPDAIRCRKLAPLPEFPFLLLAPSTCNYANI